MNVACKRQTCSGFDVEACKDVVVGNSAAVLAPRASLLHVQHINRYMLRPHPLNPAQVFFPDFEALVWEPGDQVDVDVVETVLPERSDITQHVGRRMEAAGLLEILVLKGLGAEADSVHSCHAIGFELRIRESA